MGQATKARPGRVTNAKELVVALENCDLHAMTRKEADTLHELLDSLRIDIETTWARWDN